MPVAGQLPRVRRRTPCPSRRVEAVAEPDSLRRSVDGIAPMEALINAWPIAPTRGRRSGRHTKLFRSSRKAAISGNLWNSLNKKEPVSREAARHRVQWRELTMRASTGQQKRFDRSDSRTRPKSLNPGLHSKVGTVERTKTSTDAVASRHWPQPRDCRRRASPSPWRPLPLFGQLPNAHGPGSAEYRADLAGARVQLRQTSL